MGNWTEREVLNGSDPVEYFRHTPDARNRIAVLEHDSVNSPAGNTEPIYDEAGNLIFDGGYAYQYDAWNRLVQINTATMDTIPDQDPLQGEIEVLVVGGLIKHHTYDALGRLVRTQLPHPDPQTSAGQLRSERFYYDGVRRIQEVFVDPLDDMDEALGDPQGSSLVLQTVGSETEGAFPNAKIRRKTCGLSVML